MIQDLGGLNERKKTEVINVCWKKRWFFGIKCPYFSYFKKHLYNKTFSEKNISLLYTSAHNMISSTKGRLLRSDEHLQVLEEIQLRMDNGGQLVTVGSPPLVWDEWKTGVLRDSYRIPPYVSIRYHKGIIDMATNHQPPNHYLIFDHPTKKNWGKTKKCYHPLDASDMHFRFFLQNSPSQAAESTVTLSEFWGSIRGKGIFDLEDFGGKLYPPWN